MLDTMKLFHFHSIIKADKTKEVEDESIKDFGVGSW